MRPSPPVSQGPLAALIDGFQRRRPMRAGSLIVTVFGDAIAPRGGELWLGSLIEIMGLFGVEPGLVRTALSRLVGEGWLERTRHGRNSFYRLSPTGRSAFAAATQRIYHTAPRPWDGRLRMALLMALDSGDRVEARDQLMALGFGQAAPTVLIRPEWQNSESEHLPPGVVSLISQIENDPGAARALGAACWQLGALAQSYRQFIDTFGAFAAKSPAAPTLNGPEAFQLRALLIHEYRRVLLRDPLLPQELLPLEWPGTEARLLCGRLYRRLVASSERWLTAHTQCADGSLPPTGAEFASRFSAH